jgi:cell wall-associated NlpC family hydrolase
VKPGDVVVFRWGRCYSHGGIVTDAASGGLRIVHAFSERRAVVEQRIDSDRILADPRRAPRYFSHWKPA